MPSPSKDAIAIDDIFSELVYPIIGYSSNENYPYYGWGTCFLVESKSKIYLITARHVLENQDIKPHEICIFTKKHKHLIPFDYEIYFKDTSSLSTDIAIIRLNQRALFEMSPPDEMRAFNLDLFCAPPTPIPDGIDLWVVGYPGCQRDYDYDLKKFKANRSIITGRPTTSEIPELLSMQADFSRISDVQGISGSPVICFVQGIPLLAGIAIMSTLQSGLIHFIRASVILEALDRLPTTDM